MEYYNEAPRCIPIKEKVNVLVVGGGRLNHCGGCCRNDWCRKVLLVERYGLFRWYAYAGSVLNMRRLTIELEILIIDGLPLEFISMLKEHGGAYGNPFKR